MFENIQNDLHAAMKAGEALKLSVLRMLVSALTYKQIDIQRELTDADVLDVVSKEAKKRREAIESYTAGNRPEQAAQEQAELVILQSYLPVMMSEADVVAEVKAKLAEMGTVDFAGAMKVLSPLFKGRADGSMVARVVKTLIASS